MGLKHHSRQIDPAAISTEERSNNLSSDQNVRRHWCASSPPPAGSISSD